MRRCLRGYGARWRRDGHPCGGYIVNRQTVDGVEQMVELVTCGVRPVAAAGGARAECAVADFDRTYGVGRIGRIFKGDGDWFVRVH